MRISEITQSNVRAVIKDLMSSLRSNHDQLTQYSGFGYCAYGSRLLGDQLEALSVPFEYVTGMEFSSNPIADSCRNHVNSIIAGMGSETDEPYQSIYKAFVSRGNQLPRRIGHGVVLVRDQIYDITSPQFDLPRVYDLDTFCRIWKTVRVVDDFPIDTESDFMISNQLTTVRVIQK